MEDTIAAISTSMAGSGGINIVRISGEQAVSVASRIFVPAAKGKTLETAESHTIHYGKIIRDGKMIDEVLLLLMRAPRTYTREDVIEIDCHGGILVTQKILEAVLAAGARLAEPGEFTKRAFLNGRIDLSQAEAVIDVIQSKNEYALQASVEQLDGKLSREVRELRDDILNHVAYMEAAMDDPEHISLDHYVDKLQNSVDNYVEKIEKLLKSAENGRIMKEGIKTVILGKTNAGKSSLLNALSKSDRAIVTDIAGTTRDILEEQITIGGVQLNLLDTAGIRQTDDLVENIGVEKAKKYAKEADLVIYVVDASRRLDDNDSEIIELIKDKKVLVLLNKSDMQTVITEEQIHSFLNCPVLFISAKHQQGFEELEETIRKLFFSGNMKSNDQIYITNIRHKQLLAEALESLQLVEQGMAEGMSEDLLTIDLMTAYEKLGEILGEEIEDDLASRIFSRFCMGK